MVRWRVALDAHLVATRLLSDERLDIRDNPAKRAGGGCAQWTRNPGKPNSTRAANVVIAVVANQRGNRHLPIAGFTMYDLWQRCVCVAHGTPLPLHTKFKLAFEFSPSVTGATDFFFSVKPFSPL